MVCWRDRAARGFVTLFWRNHGNEILRRLFCDFVGNKPWAPAPPPPPPLIVGPFDSVLLVDESWALVTLVKITINNKSLMSHTGTIVTALCPHSRCPSCIYLSSGFCFYLFSLCSFSGPSWLLTLGNTRRNSELVFACAPTTNERADFLSNLQWNAIG